jgi:SAM-dependent methyltransferase
VIERVELNHYLSVKSNWPRRLLGWETYDVRRTASHVTAEYDSDRYAPLLEVDGDAEAYKVREFDVLGMPQDKPEYFSLGEEVFRAPLSLVRQIQYAITTDLVRKWRDGALCELGCGYGFNLSYLGGDVYGGDFSANAVRIGKRLGFDVCSFDYYDPATYEFIRPQSTILTVHSVEQIPDASPFIDNLSRQRGKIGLVIQIEPTFLPERATLLGMIRNRFNEMIDHNRNLFTLLRERADIEILAFERDVFGIHPLNPASTIVWRFR